MELWSGKNRVITEQITTMLNESVLPRSSGGVSRSSHPQKEQMPYKVKWRTNPIPTLVFERNLISHTSLFGVHSICPCAKIQMHKPQPTQEEMCLHWVSWWIQGVEVLLIWQWSIPPYPECTKFNEQEFIYKTLDVDTCKPKPKQYQELADTQDENNTHRKRISNKNWPTTEHWIASGKWRRKYQTTR